MSRQRYLEGDERGVETLARPGETRCSAAAMVAEMAEYYYSFLLLFLTNLYLTTHNQRIGHSNTNTVPVCAVFSLGRTVPARQDP